MKDEDLKCQMCGRRHCKNQKHVPLTVPDWAAKWEEDRVKEIKKDADKEKS